MEENINVLEAILFATGRVVLMEEIEDFFEINNKDTEELVNELKNKYEGSGINIVKVKDGYQMVSNKKYFYAVSEFLENSKKEGLSTTCLEVLSIIAYNSRITKSQIEDIRGVNSDSQVSRLLEYGLIEEIERLKLPGRPAVFSTTNEFLKCMGMTKLEELPDYEKMKDIKKEKEVKERRIEVSLEIILGKSNSKKNEYLFKKILEDEKKSCNVILFVPEIEKSVIEKDYMFFTNKKHISNTKITPISKYIEKSLDEDKLTKNKKRISSLAKKIYIKNEIEEICDTFNIFEKIKDKQGFIEYLIKYFEIFQSEDINIEYINEKYAKKDLTYDKLMELLNAFNKVYDNLNSKFITSLEELKIYTEEIKQGNVYDILNSKIYFDMYNDFSKQELKLIEVLLQNEVEIIISLNIDIIELDEETETLNIFGESKKTYLKLKKMANKLNVNLKEIKLKNSLPENDLEYLKQNIFNDFSLKYDGKIENVEIKIAPNISEEIKYITQDIYEKVLNQGYRYKDFVICTNNIEGYNLVINKFFNEYDIPVVYNADSFLKESTLSIYLLNVLELAKNGTSNIDINKMLIMLKSGLLNIDKEVIYKFENYINEYMVRSVNLNEEFDKINDRTKFRYNLEILNNIRLKIIDIIFDLSLKLKNKNKSKDIIEVIYDHLQEKGIIKNFINEVSETKIKNEEELNKKNQIIKSLYEVFDNINLVAPEINLEKFLNLLSFGIENQNVVKKSNTIDQVEIVDIKRGRTTAKDIMYVIGLNESVFPKTVRNDGLFLDNELKKLKDLNIDIFEEEVEQLNKELFDLYLVINKCLKKLVLLVPSSKMTGEALLISPIIQNIKNVLDIKNDSTNSKEQKNFALKDRVCNLFNEIKDFEDKSKQEKQEIYTEYNYLLENEEKIKKILKYKREDFNLRKEILEKLYSGDVKSSVSRLERLRRCPFAYNMEYILKLNENKSAELSSLDIGNIMHESIEKVSRYLISKDIAWHEIFQNETIKNDIKNQINTIIDNIFNQKHKKQDGNIRKILQIKKIKQNIVNIILVISESFNQSDFEPLGYEIGFGENEIFAPIEINLNNGKKVHLVGKIDRVDISSIEDKTYLRVVDYKSSNKDLKLKDIKEGISLQLMTYMAALLNNKEKIVKDKELIPAAINYFTVNINISSIKKYDMNEDNLKKQLIKKLKLKGIYINDVKILNKLDRKAMNKDESYIDINASKLKGNNDKYLAEDLFLKECENMNSILKKMAEEIINGNVKIKPYDKMTCTYCKYFSICRKTSFL